MANQHAAAIEAEANLSLRAPDLAKVESDADGTIILERCPLASAAEILAAAPELRAHANSDALARVRDDDVVAKYVPDLQLIVCRVESEGLFVAAQLLGDDEVRTVVNRTAGFEPIEFGGTSTVLGGVMQPFNYSASGEGYSLSFWSSSWTSDGIMLTLGTSYARESVPDTAQQIAVEWLEQLVPSMLRAVSTMTITDVARANA